MDSISKTWAGLKKGQARLVKHGLCKHMPVQTASIFIWRFPRTSSQHFPFNTLCRENKPSLLATWEK
jgi:hypothetical protein